MKSLPFNVTFQEAVKFFRAKVPLTREEFNRLADWAKLRAFTAATVTKANALQRMQNAIRAAIEEGLTFDDFKAVVDDVVDVALAPHHAELVFRNNTQSAYGSGRLEQQRTQRDDFPFLQLHEIDDDRTRESHRAANGTVRPLGDPYWRTHYPPWGHNCRGYCESLTESEARAIGVAPVNILDDSEGEGFTSPGASDAFDPDLNNLDPASAGQREARASRVRSSGDRGLSGRP